MPHIRFHDRIDEMDAAAWDALRPDDNPFVSHAFLGGLERHGCILRDYGWQAHHVGVYADGRLTAAAPLYLKGNSHGEYVFDWAWADAYARHGLAYYPKLLCAIPYSPVPGPRLLVGSRHDAESRRVALITAIEAETARLDVSSAHLNFALDEDAPAAQDAGWLPRSDWQYHWHNRGWPDFDAFLAALSHRKRKNIRAERHAVARAGLDCSLQAGNNLDAGEWAQIHALYQHTFDEKGNHATLTAPFFVHLGACLGDHVQVAIARYPGDDTILAMALFLRSADTLYGRYWGAWQHIPDLHFELCYYQGIDYCVREGLAHFEPGAQGQHKIARGFTPTCTLSYHYIADTRFRGAIAAALEQETMQMNDYGERLRAHSPYAGDR